MAAPLNYKPRAFNGQVRAIVSVQLRIALLPRYNNQRSLVSTAKQVATSISPDTDTDPGRPGVIHIKTSEITTHFHSAARKWVQFRSYEMQETNLESPNISDN
jgi:hypothetical protein